MLKAAELSIGFIVLGNYVYCSLNKNGAMFKSPLVTTYPREGYKEYLCKIRFTTNSVNVDEDALINFIEKFFTELRNQFDFEILTEPYIKKKDFERQIGNVQGTVTLLTASFGILVRPNFAPQKEIEILQDIPDAKADRERRTRMKYAEIERKLFGNPKQTSSANLAPKA